MAKYAVIHNDTNRVVNVILWDGQSEWKPPVNHYVIEDAFCSIGEIYDKNSKIFVKEK